MTPLSRRAPVVLLGLTFALASVAPAHGDGKEQRSEARFTRAERSGGERGGAAQHPPDGKVETIGAFVGPASPSIAGALEAAGYRVTLADGSVACEVWFRKDGPGLALSAFVGLVTFPQNTNDFRGQALKAGSYTLRYAVMPGDGNHLGAAPTTDFLVLSPLAEDTDAAARPDFPALMKLSAKAAGLNHPAPLNLAEVEDRKDYPAVVKNEHGHEVFFVKLKTAKGELPIGLVVKGRTDH